MLSKKLTLAVSTVSVMIACTACSPKEKTNTSNTTASTPASTTTNTTASTTEPVFNVASTPASSTTIAPVETTTPASNVTATPNIAPKATTNNNTTKSSETLKSDLTLLLKTINDIDNKNAKKQQEFAEKMQTAQDPKALVEVYQEINNQLNEQKSVLNGLTFQEARMKQLRQKMVSSIDDNQQMIQLLIKKPDANPETDPNIAKIAEKGQKSAIETREMLMQLVQEAGINPQDVITPQQ